MVDNFGLTSSFHNFSYTVDLLLIFLVNECWLNVDQLLTTEIFVEFFTIMSQIFKVFQNEVSNQETRRFH